MTEVPDRVRRAFADQGDFDRVAPDRFVLASTPFDATVTVADDEGRVAFEVIVRVPMLSAVAADVAPVVEDGWYETFELRLEDVGGALRGDHDDADLTVERDGVAFTVRGYDDLVAVDLPSFGAALDLWRDGPVEGTDAVATLAAAGLTAEIRVRGAPVARLGADAVPSPLAKRLGLGPIQLFLDGALLALMPRRG